MLISSGGPFYFLPIAAALLCSQWMDGVFGGNMRESNTWWLLSESEMSSPLTRCVPLPGVCVHVCVLREVYRPVNLEHAQVLLVESDVAPECSWKLEDRQLLWSYMTTVILTLLNVDEQSLYMCTLCVLVSMLSQRSVVNGSNGNQEEYSAVSVHSRAMHCALGKRCTCSSLITTAEVCLNKAFKPQMIQWSSRANKSDCSCSMADYW